MRTLERIGFSLPAWSKTLVARDDPRPKSKESPAVEGPGASVGHSARLGQVHPFPPLSALLLLLLFLTKLPAVPRPLPLGTILGCPGCRSVPGETGGKIPSPWSM